MRSAFHSVLVLLFVVPLSLLAGCGAETKSAPQIRLPEGVGDVLPLGLDVNPKDGALYVRTDKGTFRVGRDARQATALEAELQTAVARIPLREDLTFAFVGPDQLVGSGHPAEKGSAPENLGLLSSRDGGATWSSVSLLGEVDLHPVRPRGSQLIASTSNGPLVSIDMAKSWRPLGNGDAAYFAWRERDELFFVDGAGQAFMSRDGGKTSESLGRIPGEPRGLAVAADGTLWAVTEDLVIHRSRDNGKTWTKLQLAVRDV